MVVMELHDYFWVDEDVVGCRDCTYKVRFDPVLTAGDVAVGQSVWRMMYEG